MLNIQIESIIGATSNEVKKELPLSLQLQGLAVSAPDDTPPTLPLTKLQQAPLKHHQSTPRSDGTPRILESKSTPRRSNKPRPLGKPQAKHVVGQISNRRSGPGVAYVGGAPASNLCPPLRGCMVTRRQLKQRHSLQLARNVAISPPPVPPQSQATYLAGQNVVQSTSGLLTTRGSKLDPSSSLRC